MKKFLENSKIHLFPPFLASVLCSVLAQTKALSADVTRYSSAQTSTEFDSVEADGVDVSGPDTSSISSFANRAGVVEW